MEPRYGQRECVSGATGVRDHSWKPLTTSSRPDACTDPCTRYRLRSPTRQPDRSSRNGPRSILQPNRQLRRDAIANPSLFPLSSRTVVREKGLHAERRKQNGRIQLLFVDLVTTTRTTVTKLTPLEVAYFFFLCQMCRVSRS